MCCGLVSAGLLAASLVWAHHWNARADALVAAWGSATLAAFALSGRVLLGSGPRQIAAKIGLALATLSLFALGIAGIAAAAGADPSGMCGGG
jgi:hypothetical protein